MRTVTPEAIASTLKDQFNIDMDIYLVVKHSAKALELMGMIATRKGIALGLVENYCIKLPPEVVKISSVIWTSKPMDTSWKYEIQDITHPPQIIFRMDEADEVTIAPKIEANYIPSHHYGYIPYVWECPYLKINDTNIEVLVEYSIMSLDKNGYPAIPETVTDACVYYCVFVHMQPLFLLGKVAPIVFAEVTKWKNQKIRQGETNSIMRGLSNNEKNNILKILTSFDRKQVNIDA